MNDGRIANGGQTGLEGERLNIMSRGIVDVKAVTFAERDEDKGR